MVNVNLSRRARAIEIERERNLSIAFPNFGCELTAPEFIVAAGNTTKTLLASYPGSGKRFVYQLIEGLTNHAPGDDHELSFNGLETLHIKTSYPHSEGVWSWGSRMDQMILLIRNPRWAIPSYHTMKFELLLVIVGTVVTCAFPLFTPTVHQLKTGIYGVTHTLNLKCKIGLILLTFGWKVS